ncbi:MAG: Crp/Fnr family transcriptional regulator [Spirochaetales bacterium]|nr:Crp/Fnr family transcriptional regulator [Spirochaetales bacterium]
MDTCHLHCFELIPLFDSLSSERIQHLETHTRKKHFVREQMLFHQGALLEGLWVIRHGKVKLAEYDASGKEHIQEVVHDGDVIGEQLFLTGEACYPFSAVCLTEVDACLIPAGPFRKELDENPELMRSVARSVGEKLGNARHQNLILTENDAMSRVALYMLQQDEHCLNHEISLGIDDIAAMINLRRETVSRKLGELVKKGVIRRLGQNKLMVADRNALTGYTMLES